MQNGCMVIDVLERAWPWYVLVLVLMNVCEVEVLRSSLWCVLNGSPLSLSNCCGSFIRAWSWSVNLLYGPRVLRRWLADTSSETLRLSPLQLLHIRPLEEWSLSGVPLLSVRETDPLVLPNTITMFALNYLSNFEIKLLLTACMFLGFCNLSLFHGESWDPSC